MQRWVICLGVGLAVAAVAARAEDPGRRAQAMGFVRLLDDPRLGDVAGRALAAMGEDAVPALGQAVADLNSRVRAEAVGVLAQIGGEAATAELRRAAEMRDGAVRVAACRALVAMGEKSDAIVAGLARSLADPREGVRQAAAAGLEEAGSDAKAAIPSLVQALGDPNAAVREQAQAALSAMGVVTVDRLREGTRSDDPVQRAAAVTTIGRIGPDAKGAVPRLVEMLGDPSPRVRREAVDALGRMGEAARDAAGALREVVQDTDASSALREQALLALEAVDAEAIAKPASLMELWMSDHALVRRYAARRFGEQKVEEAVPHLLVGVNDPSHLVREEAALALARIAPGSDDVVAVLAGAVEDKLLLTPRVAARALGEMGGEARDAKGALERAAAQTEDEELAAAARDALDKIG